MFRLKILWRELDLRKCKSVSERKRLPIFVSTFLLYGGLYQMMFRGRVLSRAGVSLWDSLYARLTYNLLTKAATSIILKIRNPKFRTNTRELSLNDNNNNNKFYCKLENN